MTIPREFRSLNSSMITGAAYDEETQTMYIEFADSSRYEYDQVPEDAYEDLCSASSAGSFFHSQIKGLYRTRRV